MSRSIPSFTEDISDLKWKRYDQCCQVIQVALATIIGSGIAIATLFHYGYVDHIYLYIGGGLSSVAVISLCVCIAYKTNQLKDIIKQAQSFTELNNIIKKTQVSDLCISFFGSRKVSVAGIRGDISVDDLAFRIEKMVEKTRFAYSEEERIQGEQVVKRITELFKESDHKVDEKNCFSRCCYYFPNIFSLLSITATIHGRWFYGNGEGADTWFDEVVSRRPKELLPRFFA